MNNAPAADVMRVALRQCRRHFLAAGLFSALINLLYIAPTLYMLQVYDRVVPTQGLRTLLFLTLVLLFALATLALLDRVRSRLLVRAGVQLDRTLAPLILDAAIERPDLPIARQALREFDTVRGALTGGAALALFDAPWFPLYILVCFLVHPWIGLVALIGCTALPLLAWATERAIRARLDRAQASAAASYANQDVLLAASDSVRALGMRRAMVARQRRQRGAMLIAQTEASFAASGYLTVTKFTRLALQSLALGLGALLAVDNLISAGAIFAASFLIARALAPIEQLVGTWKTIVQARQSYRAIATLVEGAAATGEPTRLPRPRGAVTLDGVTILNDTRDGAILNGIALRIEPGEVVAVIGPSGAGKSTLARAIAGAQRPDRGAVRFDGADARDWNAEELATHIGYLPQDAVLFAGTVAENIARFEGELGTPRAAIDAGVVAAAEKVGADALIRALRGGYDHELKLGGRGVSAGQAQRIGLARAFYGDPAVLILDEPNAHLDQEGDQALIAAIAAAKAEKRTVLVVSHKLGILPVIDRILVLRDGRVEMYGPRDEVLAKIMPQNLRPVPATREAAR